KGILSLPDLQNIERRCGSAYEELGLAHLFDHVIANHDGEDSENWDAFPIPLGDAGRTLSFVVALLEGRTPAGEEAWDRTLLSGWQRVRAGPLRGNPDRRSARTDAPRERAPLGSRRWLTEQMPRRAGAGHGSAARPCPPFWHWRPSYRSRSMPRRPRSTT